MNRLFPSSVCLAVALGLARIAPAAEPVPLRQRLQDTPFKIAYESYVNENWDLFVVNADGSDPVNLTRTPKIHEHYPQVSADGRKICFVADEGEGRDTIRSLWVMDSNGQNRRKLREYAREPFWTPDGISIGYLPQEYPKFNVIDYFTKGMDFYDLATGRITPHPNSERLHHTFTIPVLRPTGNGSPPWSTPAWDSTTRSFLLRPAGIGSSI